MDVKGRHGTVTFDGQTVTITKPLRGETRIAARDIAAVEINRAGLGMLAIRFVTHGAQPRRATAFGSTSAAQQDPYALVVRSGKRSEVEALREAVEQAR